MRALAVGARFSFPASATEWGRFDGEVVIEKRLLFAAAFEGLYLRALKDRLTPELKARLRAEGFDPEQRLEPAYPFEVWTRCVDATAQVLYPSLKRADAHWKLGEDTVRGYVDTTLGRALFALLRLLGPMKAIARMQRNFRSGNNYVETRFAELSPTSAELWMSGVNGEPWFNAGVLAEGGRQMKMKNLRVEILDCHGDEATYRLSWDA